MGWVCGLGSWDSAYYLYIETTAAASYKTHLSESILVAGPADAFCNVLGEGEVENQ